MRGVKDAAAQLRCAVHLARAVVGDGGGREAAGSWASTRARAQRRDGLHVEPDERPIRARGMRGRLAKAGTGRDVRAEALAGTAAAQLWQDVGEKAVRLSASAGQVGGDGVPDGVVAHDA